MNWTGGVSGSVDISGLDYNDVVCTYVVPDCTQQVIKMNCSGAGYDTELIIYSQDSFKLGPTFYARVP